MVTSLMSPPRPLLAGLRAATQIARLTLSVAPSPDAVVGTAATVVRSGIAALVTTAREAGPATRAVAELKPERTHRRVWAAHGQAQIEVRGMTGTGPEHRAVARSVLRQLRRLRGVRWAEINAVTGRVLVAFDDRRIDVSDLLETVRGVEAEKGTREAPFPWSRPVHPADPAPIAAAGMELAADCVSLATAVAGRVLRLPATPPAVRAAQALLELERPLRRRLKRRIGPIGTDVVLALTAAAVHGVSQKPLAPAVDVLYRMELLAEAVSRRAVWERREEQLFGTGTVRPDAPLERPARPVPRPDGPIERWTAKVGPGALGAAGLVLGLTRQPHRAADAILAAVPHAARLGREGYAATVGRELAGRGVVALNAAAWRRLDRVSAIVIDSAVLCTDRPQILTVEPGSADATEVWRGATAVLGDRSMRELAEGEPVRHEGLRIERAEGDDEPGTVHFVLWRGRRRLGRVRVGHELDPIADAVLDAARSSGARIFLTRHGSVADLVPRVDDVLASDEPIVAHVQRLQRDGEGVLVLANSDTALAAADVGVAVLGGDTCTSWSADLVCGPGLTGAWRILAAAGVARSVSERGVRLAQAGSALGELLALVGGGSGGPTQAQVPVYCAALASLVQGTVAGLTATHRPVPAAVTHVPWHAMDAEDVLSRLDGRRSDDAPEDRSPLTGRIRVPFKGGLRVAGAVKEELSDPLTPILAVGAAASAIVGSGIDTVLVAAVMTGNALISGVQRIGAERALRRLYLQQEVNARLLRRQALSETTGDALDTVPTDRLPAKQLAAGDVIALRAADVVPADARLLWSADLEVDESTLTGESVPTEKGVAATPAAPFAERHCMVYEGTTVLAGRGYAVVVATGDATAAGRAASAAGRAAPPAGLQAQLAKVTAAALPATGIGGGVVTGLALLRRVPLREAVAAGVSVAVAAVPEGLPLVATVAQAAAARRLSGHGVLVRSSRTLEALGRVDVVCFDKTGTLTEGKLVLARIASADADVDESEPFAQRILTTAARACPAVPAGEVSAATHATDRAVLDAAFRSTVVDHEDGWRLHAELPFETNRGYSVALGDASGTPVLAVKGAPEVILPLCGRIAGSDEAAGSDGTGGSDGATGSDGAGEEMTARRKERVQRTVERLAADGLRVLAVAEREANLPTGDHLTEDAVAELTLLGFVGVADTPRADATEALRRITDDGIRMIMVTGDHPTTATAIARMVGMPAGRVLTGDDLDQMPERERIRAVAEASVFARVSPEQKLRIVEALQAEGRVVAMTGDGTNDAAAIRLADVGIGVAASGSSAARTAADLVLAEVDIGHIYEAILEGRALWRGVRDAVSILVGGNAGEIAFMVFGTALAGRAPIGVRQMLLVNMLTDMFPALAVAVAPHRAGSAGQDGQDPSARGAKPDVLGRALARAIAIRGGATTVGALGAWIVGRYTGRPARASTMGLAAVVGTQLGQTLVTGRRSPLVVATVLASAVVLFAIVETPGVSQFFGCTPIGPVAWTVVGGSAAAGTLAAAVMSRSRLLAGGGEPVAA
jgi:cation-transporting ATPase I